MIVKILITYPLQLCNLPKYIISNLHIANVRGLSSTLDGDGGIAAPKKILYSRVPIGRGVRNKRSGTQDEKCIG